MEEKYLWEYDKQHLTELMLVFLPEPRSAKKINKPQFERLSDVGHCDGCKKKTDRLELWYFAKGVPWKMITRLQGHWYQGAYHTYRATLIRSWYVCEDCLQTALSWQQVKRAEESVKRLQWSMKNGRHRSS